MTQTRCGNLTPVRSLRNRPDPRSPSIPLYTVVLSAFLLVPGCASERAEPEPAGSKPREAEADPGTQAPQARTEDEHAQRTAQWRERIADDPTLANTARFFEAKADLERASNEASDPHLKANASLSLGVLYEGRKDTKGAIAAYRHAAKLVPDDAGPHMALALALAGDSQFAEAVEAQKTATTLDPDNLENWLVLGELLVKSGDQEAAAAAYVDYERRRKGLIDGLTLTNKQGEYIVTTQERAGCAEALASATDEGTAVALTYALKSDPEPDVQATVASVMGVQRLTVYRPALEAALPKAQGEVKEAIAWALTEIERDPVNHKRPELPPTVLDAASTVDEAPAAPRPEEAAKTP